jgi:uncharacterized protein (TIGR02246 family)
MLAIGIPASSAQPNDPKRETEAILQVIAQTTEAFNAHDAQRFASFYTPTATLVTVRGERMSGTTEIVKGLGSIFATRANHARLQQLDYSVTFLTSDVAVAHVLNELGGVPGANGEPVPPHQELSIRVFVKLDGVWRVAAFHNTIVQDKPVAVPHEKTPNESFEPTPSSSLQVSAVAAELS